MSESEAILHTCQKCGSELDLNLEGVVSFHEAIDTGRGLPWRYSALLPVDYAPEMDDKVVPRTVRSRGLESVTGANEVWLIDCTCFGTGTFKDLEAAVVMAGCRQLNQTKVSIHSTGNTALAYRHYAMRAGVECAGFVPQQNTRKFGDAAPSPGYPVYLVNSERFQISAVARRVAADKGWRHLAPPGWRLEGKAALGYWIYERTPKVNVVVQTVAGGWGPLGYELAFDRIGRLAGQAGVALADRRYLLFQPADADSLTEAWRSGRHNLQASELKLPTNPFEPTLQSTNPVSTLPQLRRSLPEGTQLRSVDPETVMQSREIVESFLWDAGIVLDYERERSAYISLAGLLGTKFDSDARVAVVVTGSRPFKHLADPTGWEALDPNSILA